MNALQKMRDFIAQYPGYDILNQFRVDYTDQIPNNGGIFPNGLLEIGRSTDIFGVVTVSNQYNFAIYYVFEKSPGDDMAAIGNADWISDFQEWIQEMSCKGMAPAFGDEPETEKITAQNGILYDADEEGTATYAVQLSVSFIKNYY